MKNISTRIFVSALISIIFIVDIIIPPGTALAILYIIPMAITFKQSKKMIVSFALICCVLTLIDDIVYFDPKLEYSIFVDSILAMIAIGLSSFATIKYKSLKEKSEKRKEENMAAILEMLFMTSHRLRQPICSIQGLNTLLDNNEPSKDELKNISFYLKDSITKLDIYSRDLTDFLTKIRTQEEIEN